MLLCILFVFFFKQKTAYEMRISDWSSDVCSSDLAVDDEGDEPGADGEHLPGVADIADDPGHRLAVAQHRPRVEHRHGRGRRGCGLRRRRHEQQQRDRQQRPERPGDEGRLPAEGRSEEHTSELQSLMRISYAVFCLKKKTT